MIGYGFLLTDFFAELIIFVGFMAVFAPSSRSSLRCIISVCRLRALCVNSTTWSIKDLFKLLSVAMYFVVYDKSIIFYLFLFLRFLFVNFWFMRDIYIIYCNARFLCFSINSLNLRPSWQT